MSFLIWLDTALSTLYMGVRGSKLGVLWGDGQYRNCRAVKSWWTVCILDKGFEDLDAWTPRGPPHNLSCATLNSLLGTCMLNAGDLNMNGLAF